MIILWIILGVIGLMACKGLSEGAKEQKDIYEDWCRRNTERHEREEEAERFQHSEDLRQEAHERFLRENKIS
jgi:hypothetical protein